MVTDTLACDPLAMSRKVPRPDEQVEQLAAEFRRRWVAADGVEPWLRRHAARLTRLVRNEGWSWSDIGRAMTAAGIAYGTGKPWSGTLLAVKVGQVRAQLRRRDRDRTASVDRTAAPSGSVAQATPQPNPTPSLVRQPDGAQHRAASLVPAVEPPDEEPEFRFVSFRNPPPASFTPLPAPPAPRPRPKVDVNEMLRRFRGEAAPSPSKGPNDDDEGH